MNHNLPVSLVFSDIVMPGGMSGYELADWLIRNRPEVKIILTSGYNNPHQVNSTDALNEKIALINKPYPLDQLARTIRKELDSEPAL